MVLGPYDITPYLHLPDLITVVIIPLIMFIIALKFFLDRLKIFKNTWVNFGLSCVIGVVSLPVIINFSFFVTRACGLSYGPTKLGINIKGIIVGIVSMAVTWIVLPIVADLIPTIYF